MSRKRDMAQQSEAFDQAMVALEAGLTSSAEEEQAVRAAENPPINEVLDAVEGLRPLTWTRRPESVGFLSVRLGLGRRPSRTVINMPDRPSAGPAIDRILTLRNRFELADPVPVLAQLAYGALGVAGDDSVAKDIARAVVGQLIGLHSPAEVVVAAVASPATAAAWDWLKWTPHVSSPNSPLNSDHLAVSRSACLSLVADVESLIEERSGRGSGIGDDEVNSPFVILLIEDDAIVDRSRLMEIAKRGPAHGVSTIWCTPSAERLPSSCRTYVDVNRLAGVVQAVFVDDRMQVPLSQFERLGLDAALTHVPSPGAARGHRIARGRCQRSACGRVLCNAGRQGTDVVPPGSPRSLVGGWINRRPFTRSAASSRQGIRSEGAYRPVGHRSVLSRLEIPGPPCLGRRHDGSWQE